MLFGSASTFPTADLNQQGHGNGKAFFDAFSLAAAATNSYLVPDPWSDDPTIIPALPNKVPRPAAFVGPIVTVMGGLALDAGSLDPITEDDIVDSSGVPRPARLDDISTKVETSVPGTPPFYPWRQQANIFTEHVIHLPSIVYFADGYHFTDQMHWWNDVCAGLPCFLQLGWPGYETAIIDDQIDGHDIVLQIWKGWCPRLGDMTGMPGGVGVELGVYRRIPNQLSKFLAQIGADPDTLAQKIIRGLNASADLPKKLALLQQQLSLFIQQKLPLSDATTWWPYPELNAAVSFTLKDPANGNVIFDAKPQNTYWRVKWMQASEYDTYAAAHGLPRYSSSYRLGSWDLDLEFTITVDGAPSPITGTWTKSGGIKTTTGSNPQTFGRPP